MANKQMEDLRKNGMKDDREKMDNVAPRAATGGFVITPYGPMYVFDVPAPKKPEPEELFEEEVVEEVVEEAPKKRSAKAIVGLIFSILGVLLCPVFPFSLLGIILGAVGRKDRKKTGTAAIVLGVIGLILCAAAVVWAFLFGGQAVIIDLLKGWGLIS